MRVENNEDEGIVVSMLQVHDPVLPMVIGDVGPETWNMECDASKASGNVAQDVRTVYRCHACTNSCVIKKIAMVQLEYSSEDVVGESSEASFATVAHDKGGNDRNRVF